MITDNFNLRLQAGLTWTGKNQDSEDEYIGTMAQWDEYQRLLDERDEI